MTLQLKYTKTDSLAREPDRFEEGSVGYDLYAIRNKTIPPNEIEKIDTGIVLEMQGAYYAQIFDKSSVVTYKKLKVVAGVIDATYRGSIIVTLYNTTNKPQQIHSGEKIAQLVFLPIMLPKLIYQEEIEMDTTRGTRGFGGCTFNT